MKLQSANIKWKLDHLRFRCFSHILNLAAQAALSEVKEEVDKVNFICYILFFFKLYILTILKLRDLHAAIHSSPQ